MTPKKATIGYIAVLVILAVTTVLAVMDGGYHIAGGAIALIAFVSAVTSLLPFFLSRFLFRKCERNREEKQLKVGGLILYLFCFPVKLCVIISNVDLLIRGGGSWSFG